LRFPLSSLPKGFVLSKPISQDNYDEAEIYKLEKEGRLVITRKYDGWKIIAVIGKRGKVQLYTAGLNEIDARLDHIKKELRSLKLPPNTVLVGEGCMKNVDGKDNIGKTISVFQGSLEKSLKFQAEWGNIQLIIFDILILNGSFEIGTMKEKIDMVRGWCVHPNLAWFIMSPFVLNTSFDKAKRIVVENSWEGLVLYDNNFQHIFRLDGRAPKRPSGCYKWKPILEDDFIVRDFVVTDNNPEKFKEVILLQIDPVTKREFEFGRLGTFNKETRARLVKRIYPFVMQVAFDMRFPKSGKIRNARFVRIREDKPIHECLAPRSYNPQ